MAIRCKMFLITNTKFIGVRSFFSVI